MILINQNRKTKVNLAAIFSIFILEEVLIILRKMKRKIILMLCTMSLLQLAVAQNVIKLWPNGAPGNNECPQPEETFQGKMVRFVSEAR